MEHVIAYAGLAPVTRLAGRCGLGALVGVHVAIADQRRVNAPAQAASIVAAMSHPTSTRRRSSPRPATS
ncbi:hypothetical protein ACIBQX_02420 [Nonomuraea sp. NPDC049714]|uniref:hypothetical protein n=1 Tax=Nonomuraea sp. NPDC049714 TaxID=3364357 RepID=UPI0037AEE0C3